MDTLLKTFAERRSCYCNYATGHQKCLSANDLDTNRDISICRESLLSQGFSASPLWFKGFKFVTGAPSVSHSLFVDDSLMPMKALDGNAAHLQYVLDLYEDAEDIR